MEAKFRLLTIGEVARLSGVGVSTLRKWEDTYGLLTPVRSKGRFRLYSVDDVERVLALKQALLVEKIPVAMISESLVDTRRTALQKVRRSDDFCAPGTLGPEHNGVPVNGSQRSRVGEGGEIPSTADEAACATDLHEYFRSLHQATVALTRSLDSKQVIEQTLSQACSLLEAEASALLLFGHTSGQRFCPQAITKSAYGVISTQLNELDRAIVTGVCERAGTLIVQDAYAWADGHLLLDAGLRSLLAIPLRYAGNMIGILCVVGIAARDFSLEHRVLADAFANIAACAFENATCLERATDAYKRADLLLGIDAGLILLADGQGVIADLGPRTKLLTGYEPIDLLGRSMLDLMAPSSRHRLWEYLDRGEESSRGRTCEVDFLRNDGQVFRVEVRELCSRDSCQMERRLFVASDVSQKKCVERELVKRNQELSVLGKLAEALSEALDLDEVLQLAVDTVVRITDKETGNISLVDEQTGELVLKAHCNAPEHILEHVRRLKLGDGISGRVAITGESIHVQNIANDWRSTSAVPYAKQRTDRQFVCTPLKSKNKVVGTLMITSKQFEAISAEEVQLFSSLGHLIGSAVERARMHEQSVKGYHDRLVLMRDEFRLATHFRTQERLRIASELRDYVLCSLNCREDSEKEACEREGGDEERGLGGTSRALSALQALERELAASKDGGSLPERLDMGVRWRAAYDPAGCTVKVVWDSWPEGVPDEVTLQLYTVVVKLLASSREAVPGADIEIALVESNQSIGLKVTRSNPGIQSAGVAETYDWRRTDLSGVSIIVNSLGGKAILEPYGEASTLTITVPRYWDQAPRQKPITVLIVNDQALPGQAMASLLENQESVQVLGIAQNAQEAMHLVKRLPPDLIIVDISAPALKGIETTRVLRAAFPSSRILILTPDQGASVVEGLLVGATGFVHKGSTPLDLFRAINSMLQSEPTLTREIAERALALLSPSSSVGQPSLSGQRLTPREVGILRLIAAGKSSKDICRILQIKEKTVRTHISNMYQKLQVFDRAQLVLYAARSGLVDIEN